MPLPSLASATTDIGLVPQPPRPVREFIPHTTHAKAELYLVIAPQLESLADELMALNLKTTGLAAEPQVVHQAAGLLRDARRLLRGEPGAHLADLDFAPPLRVQTLALGLRQLSRAVAGFRQRYYGYNPLTRGPAWAVADPFGNPDPRWLGRPAGVERTIDELNLMTAEVLRTHLHNLAERGGTPLPPDLERPKEPESPSDDDDPEPAAVPPATSRNGNRRSRRLVRAAARRSRAG